MSLEEPGQAIGSHVGVCDEESSQKREREMEEGEVDDDDDDSALEQEETNGPSAVTPTDKARVDMNIITTPPVDDGIVASSNADGRDDQEKDMEAAEAMEMDFEQMPGSECSSSSGGCASTILNTNETGGNGTPPLTTMMNSAETTSICSSEDNNNKLDDCDEEMDGDGDSCRSTDSDDDDGSYASDELDELLDEGLPEALRQPPVAKKRKMLINAMDDSNNTSTNEQPDESRKTVTGTEEYHLKEITVLVEKGKNTLEVLPGGWIEVRHSSGMPLYLHRKSRICTMSRPYFLGAGSARRHSIPLSAIPCLAYRRAQEREKTQEQADDNVACLDNSSKTAGTPTKGTLPCAKVETIRENSSLYSVEPSDVRQYCERLFQFKNIKCKRFKSWSARRKHNKELKRLQLQRPTLPEGVKLITFPIHNSGKDGGKSTKEYVMNPQGKSSVCILHEYVQHAMRQQPTYIFRELENAATPYSAEVMIGNLKYGIGYGSSKKQAKAEAAKATIELFIPQLKDQLDGNKCTKNKEVDHTTYFDQVDMEDTRITQMCNSVSEPSPYTLLLTCLQRNFGQVGSSNVKFEMISSNSQQNRFKMETGEYSVEVTAANKREGKQLASQAMLKKIHPHIHNFGSFLRLYGNSSIKSVKEKKQEEQQITTLQSKASANSPNYAILEKLRNEMRKLREQEAKPPLPSFEHELGLV